MAGAAEIQNLPPTPTPPPPTPTPIFVSGGGVGGGPEGDPWDPRFDEEPEFDVEIGDAEPDFDRFYDEQSDIDIVPGARLIAVFAHARSVQMRVTAPVVLVSVEAPLIAVAVHVKGDDDDAE